jgi:RimJ/RimL family protein N-acetyltransferase
MSILDYLPIHTDRLILRQTSRDDVDLILKMDKQESTQKFLGGIKNKSRDERIEFLDRKHNNGNSLTVMLDNVSIGFVGLKVTDNIGEVSYIFDSDYTGKGYCTEVIRALIDIGFNKLEINKIYATVLEENIASIRVLEKNNFKRNGMKDKFIYYELWKEGMSI